MKALKFTTEDILYLCMGIFILFLVAKEAWVIPVTHDEVNTIELSHRPIWDIITYTDPVPNNHILNTLMIKASQSIFGDHLMAARLHNVASFLLFFIFTVLTGRILFRDDWLRLAFTFMLVLQPYLLDFFSVTRGYGLSLSFEMMSLYYFFRMIHLKSAKDVVWSACWAAVGVYANFTLLNYFVPLIFLLGVHSYIIFYDDQRKSFYSSIRILAVVGLLLALLCYMPFTRMMATKQFVYWGTSGFIVDTIKPLIISLRSGTEYFGWDNEKYYKYVFVILSIAGAMAIGLWKIHPNKQIFTYALSLLLLAVLYNHVQFWLADIPFLNARTALFFIPLVCLVLCLGMEAMLSVHKLTGLLLIVLTVTVSLQHFVRGYNGKSCYEWSGDAENYVVLKDLEDIISGENIAKPVKVNCHWVFHPSLDYHIHHSAYKDMMELVPYHKDCQPDTDAKFYFTQSDELEKLSPRFDVVREYGWKTRLLLKAK